MRGVGNIDDFALRIQRLATMNNKALTTGMAGTTYQEALAMTSAARGGLSATAYMAANPATASVYDAGIAAIRAGAAPGASAAEKAAARGVAGNLLASSMFGAGTQYLGGYFRGAQGFATAGGLSETAKKGALRAVSHLDEALGKPKIVEALSKIGLRGPDIGARALEQGVFKTLGKGITLRTLGTSAGAKVLGARAAAMAIPGLQFVAAASFVYDLGRMAGEVVKSGINLARDANKSLQGSINKPMFGMGYRDTEVAATSRARGVMAIQNSRLNARSVLGSEAVMMASHFG